ncbi:MAG: hypothetical protein FWD85_04925 [Microbacteriaceae bacterium]|nr:hypothetical protein [Microbacteriaceae bacterium]MCL2794634.1 hypothetical protein [Microbacteriaceae bacterium]
MSVLTAPVGASAPRTISGPARITRVVRLHYVNWLTSVVLPWGILMLILGVNLVIWYLIRAGTGETNLDQSTQYTGSIFYLLVYQAILAIVLMSTTFTYSLSLSSTRRDYYLGTALMFVVHSAMFTAGFLLLSYLEQWTHGWGVGGHMFQTIYFGTGPLWQRAFTFYFAMLGTMFLGSIFGAVYVRWRAAGLYVVGAVFLLAVLAAGTVIVRTRSWEAVGAWFQANGSLGVVAWSIPLAAVCAVVAYLGLRRAVPRA